MFNAVLRGSVGLCEMNTWHVHKLRERILLGVMLGKPLHVFFYALRNRGLCFISE